MMHKKRWVRSGVLFSVGICFWAVLGSGTVCRAEEDPAAELVKARAEIQKAYQSLNSMNPLGDQQGTPPSTSTAPIEQKFGNELEQLQKLLSAPAVQGYLRLFSNPAFSKGINQVVGHPNRKILLYSELGLIIFIIIFRAWRFSKVRHWVARLWVNTYTWVMYLGLSIFIVPTVVFGKPYFDTVRGLIELSIQSFKN